MNLNIYHFTFFLLCYFSYPHQKLLLREMRVFFSGVSLGAAAELHEQTLKQPMLRATVMGSLSIVKEG